MRGAHSISTRRAYGVQRVCRVWHRARSASTRGGRRRRPIAGAGRSAPPRTTSWSATCSTRRLLRSSANQEHDLQAPHRVARPEGARRDHHHRGPRCDVGHGHDGHSDRGRGGGLRLRGRRPLHDRVRMPIVTPSPPSGRPPCRKRLRSASVPAQTSPPPVVKTASSAQADK